MYLLNDRCVACLDAARESGIISSSTTTTNSISNHTNTQIFKHKPPTTSSTKWKNKTQLCLDAIKNGRFLAHIQLNNFPPNGELVARLDGYSVEFFWFDKIEGLSNRWSGKKQNTTESGSLSAHTETQLYGGTVQLPFYIDVTQIRFSMESNDSIQMSAKIKGMIDRTKKSLSNHIYQSID